MPDLTVPREPTVEMERAAYKANGSIGFSYGFAPIWKAALAAAPPASERATAEWRDIATAPKDGTWVLIHEPHINTKFNNAEVARWSERHKQWVSSAGELCEPTHWQPLPAPPTAPGENNG